MKILVVASYNKERFAPFIEEQSLALERQGCELELFGLQGKGVGGYLKNLPKLNSKISKYKPDIIHAHYGLSGLLANMQRRVPVVTTYHGSDINDPKVFRFSKMAMHLSAWNIFVSQKTLDIAKPKKNYLLLPCGVDMSDLQLTPLVDAREKMLLDQNKRYVLFAGAFDNAVKNAPLAKDAVALLHDNQVNLLELKGYSRKEVTLLMCAADVFLMTSVSEGSPQVIKEALACGCPIVSVNVGDVRERIDGVEGCFVANDGEPAELSRLLLKALCFGKRTEGREKIITDCLDNRLVAVRILELYEKVLYNCRDGLNKSKSIAVH